MDTVTGIKLSPQPILVPPIPLSLIATRNIFTVLAPEEPGVAGTGLAAGGTELGTIVADCLVSLGAAVAVAGMINGVDVPVGIITLVEVACMAFKGDAAVILQTACSNITANRMNRNLVTTCASRWL